MKKIKYNKHFIFNDITLDADREYTLDEIYHEIRRKQLEGSSADYVLRVLSDLIFDCIVQESKSKKDFKNKLKTYHNEMLNIYDIYLEDFKENLPWK